MSEQRATLMIRRTASARTDRRRSYRVYLDGKNAGKIHPGQVVVFGVEPGEHEVRLRLDWCSSEPVSVRCTQGAVTQLRCAPSFPYPRRSVAEGLRLFAKMAFRPRRWIAVRVDRA